MTEYKNINRKFVSKGWGYEDWLVNKEDYCGKMLFFKKGKKCSWHYHKLKDETFYVQSGKIEMTYGFSDDMGSEKSRKIVLESGDTFYIPIGLRHQAKAILDSNVFEFSTTHFDDDSYRLIKGD